MNSLRCMPEAFAIIKGGTNAPKLCGTVRFYQLENSVLIVASIQGLPASESGFFGFHIHEGKSCRGENFYETGSHFNTNNKPHPSHSGDLPPLILCNGGAYMSFTTDRFCVNEVIGRTIVIHNMPDDFTTQPAGNSGIKIACGRIKTPE